MRRCLLACFALVAVTLAADTAKPPPAFDNAMTIGQRLLEQGKAAGARAQFLKAVELAPENVDALYYAALAQEALGNDDEAYDLVMRAGHYSPGGAAANKIDELRWRIEERRDKAHEAAIEAGKKLLDDGTPAEALAAFKKAQEKYPDDHELYFYLAVANYRLGDIDAAYAMAQEAEQRSGDGNDRVKELVTLIKARRDGDKLEREADEAYAKGLMAKAADLYVKAVQAAPKRGDLALKAAGIYADRLDKLMDAAILWQKAIAIGEPHTTAARAEIDRHHDALEALRTRELARRNEWMKNGDPREAWALAAAFPDSADVQLALAVRYTGFVDPGLKNLIGYLSAATRAGVTAAQVRAERALVRATMEKDAADYVAFLRDAFGADVANAMVNEAKKEIAEREAAEAKARAAAAKAKADAAKAQADAEAKVADEWARNTRTRMVNQASTILAGQRDVAVNFAYSGTDPQRPPITPGETRVSYLTVSSGYHFTQTVQSWVRDAKGRVTASRQVDLKVYWGTFSGLKSVSVREWQWTSATDEQFVAPATFQANAATLSLEFPNERVTRERTVTENGSGTTAKGTRSVATFNLFLRSRADFATLERIFRQLARLDECGRDVAKLKALRAEWERKG